jgi:protein-S-isoprenylcysteine O-methyltransferase Ste14
MTLGALLLYLEIGVWMGSSVVLTLTVVIFSGLLTFIYVHETRELAERFGAAYLEYRKRTPFLLPRGRHPR